MSNDKNFGLAFGIIADKLSVQIKKQGLEYDEKKLKVFEDCRHSINVLMLNGLLTDSNCSLLTRKLYNKVAAHVATKNKLTIQKLK